MKALKGFKDGLYEVLVATDVAARGIDISNVTHVINYRSQKMQRIMFIASDELAAQSRRAMPSLF